MLISKDFKFEAAHHLRDYKGKCANVHGHSYFGTVWVESATLDNIGFVIDYQEISDLINTLDHKDLNEFPEFARINPTAESIANLMLSKFIDRYPKTMSFAIKLHETASSSIFVTNDNTLKFLAV